MTTNAVITGGAGFVGSNLAASLLNDGHNVTIFDAFLRRGADDNVAWLQKNARGPRMRVVKGDVRDLEAVHRVVRDADVVFHLAGQVAVTTSVTDPRSDFETNALGTLNVLEAARLSQRPPIVIFTSTNKVYGGLEDVPVIEEPGRYRFDGLSNGISEIHPLDFHSPYGCSKGAADQYVRDYARIYKLRTVVFRMSCIYGPRQFGTEDQGWLAHFIISALTDRPMTIYGNGKQVRDVLYVGDLVRAFRLAVQKIDEISGEVFNIGGGAANTLSIWSEFSELLKQITNRPLSVDFEDWRPGDQPCYVSDIEKARKRLAWWPLVDKETGIRRLGDWIAANLALFGGEGNGRLQAGTARA